MPTDRHATIFVEVHVAAVRPLLLGHDAEHRHDTSHELHHPRRVLLRRNSDAAVPVGAPAADFHHPSRFPWDRPLRPFGLQPPGTVPDRQIKSLALGHTEWILQEASEGSSAFILQGVCPRARAAQLLAHLAQRFEVLHCTRLLPKLLRELLRHVRGPARPTGLPASARELRHQRGEARRRGRGAGRARRIATDAAGNQKGRRLVLAFHPPPRLENAAVLGEGISLGSVLKLAEGRDVAAEGAAATRCGGGASKVLLLFLFALAAPSRATLSRSVLAEALRHRAALPRSRLPIAFLPSLVLSALAGHSHAHSSDDDTRSASLPVVGPLSPTSPKSIISGALLTPVAPTSVDPLLDVLPWFGSSLPSVILVAIPLLAAASAVCSGTVPILVALLVVVPAIVPHIVPLSSATTLRRGLRAVCCHCSVASSPPLSCVATSGHGLPALRCRCSVASSSPVSLSSVQLLSSSEVAASSPVLPYIFPLNR
mmetsp:Transcript_119723/g.383367  ORF Transcript_119723/g.383367 Transcript_119723/m.383367 type:complete len:484 (-) Transcript_119723:690-2141(-)